MESQNKNAVYLCKCECGNERKVRAYKLRSGVTKSCGKCGLIKAGDTFGRLTVLDKPVEIKKHKKHYWCKCICGNEKLICGTHLRINHTKSCGCLKVEAGIAAIQANRPTAALVQRGDRFAGLVALEMVHTDPKQGRYWRCSCVCGFNGGVFKQYNMRAGITKSCGCLSRGFNIQTRSVVKKEWAKSTKWSVDLTGYDFGFARVIDRIDEKFYSVMCVCGNVEKVDSCTLKSGRYLHCGCMTEKVRNQQRLLLLKR